MMHIQLSHQALFVPTPFPLSNRSSISRRIAFRCCTERGQNVEPKSNASRKKRKWVPPKAPPNARPVSEISPGEQLFGVVCDVGPANSSWLDVGVRTISGKSVRARLRLRNTAEGSAERKTGAVIPVYVHKVNRPAARIEVRKGTPPKKGHNMTVEDTILLSDLKVGKRLTGEVVALGDYGAVLDVNICRKGRHARLVPRTGLLRRKSFRTDWASEADSLQRDDVERVVRVGDQLEVWVRVADPRNAFLELDSVPVDAATLERETIEKRRRTRQKLRRPSPESLEVGERRVGRVRVIAKFGLFVDIGVKTDGLIHYSEMGEKHKSDWKEVIEVGDEVTTEVINVQDNRIGLKLIFLREEEMYEKIAAESKAVSALARGRDVERATAFNPSNSARPTESASANVTYFERDSSPNILPEDVDMSDDMEDEDEGEDNIEDEGEDAEKFSDEYFEDKYGF